MRKSSFRINFLSSGLSVGANQWYQRRIDGVDMAYVNDVVLGLATVADETFDSKTSSPPLEIDIYYGELRRNLG